MENASLLISKEKYIEYFFKKRKVLEKIIKIEDH